MTDAHCAGSGGKTFAFRMDWGSGFVEEQGEAGSLHIDIAGHGWDIGVFLGPEKMDDFPWTKGMYDRADPGESRKIAGIMADMLVAFARTGDPSFDSFEFPAWNGEAPMVLLGTHDCRSDVSVERECDPGSRVSLQRKAWGGLWKNPLM